MFGDQTTSIATDNSPFAATFKPLASCSSFNPSASTNPFSAENSPAFNRNSMGSNLSLNSECASFIPSSTGASFGQGSHQCQHGPQASINMSTGANPFTFKRAETTSFVPSTQTSLVNDVKPFSPTASANFDDPSHPILAFMQNGQMVQITETKKYKREMCKNWTESGFCRYGLKCQYAHGAEELAEIDRITEAQARLNDKYKS